MALHLAKMSKFKFEGDIEILSDPQIKLVESVLQKQGLKDGKVVVEAVGQKGDNYVAHVKRFVYETSDGSTFKMVGKIAPVIEQQRLLMNTQLLFNNETVMYNDVLPKFNDLQNVTGVKENEKVKFPFCYGTISEAPFEFILLEDLKESGFEMFDRMQALSNESIKLVLKDLAIFHSLSYVFKNAEPETYKNISGKMINMWTLMDMNANALQFFEKLEEETLKLLQNDKHKKVVTGSVSQIAQIARELQSYEKGSNYSVFQQGDCWNNNILFRLEDGKPVQDVMIDYQLSRESNPAADILYLFFNCTDHATRLKHYQEWIDYYHEILDDSLSNHGLRASSVLPRDQLDADLRRYGKMLLGLCVILSSILVREAKDVVDMREVTDPDSMAQMSTSAMDITTFMKWKQRIEDLVDTVLEFGLV